MANNKKAFEKNSRQIPTQQYIVSNKDYCDYLYAWFQLNSERVSYDSPQRRISKKKVKYAAIEREFTRIDATGKSVVVLGRRTIPKYIQMLLEQELLEDGDDGYYYLSILNQGEAYLIEFNTLQKLTHTLQRNAISIYVYLLNRYWMNGQQPFVATMAQMKEYIGHSTATTSNNMIISDILEILKRLKLLDYNLEQDEIKSYLSFKFVKNKLPDLDEV